MTVLNPLVPPPPGSSSGSPAPVANAPDVPDATEHETSRPVTATSRGERARGDRDGRPSDSGSDRAGSRGSRVDLTV